MNQQQRIIDSLDTAPETLSELFILAETNKQPKDINALLFTMLEADESMSRALQVLKAAEPIPAVKVPTGF